MGPALGEPEEARNWLSVLFVPLHVWHLVVQVIDSLLQPAPIPEWNEIAARIFENLHDRLTSTPSVFIISPLRDFFMF